MDVGCGGGPEGRRTWRRRTGGTMDVEKAAGGDGLELPEVEVELEMKEVEVGLLKDLVISCLCFSDIAAEFLVCRIKRFVVEHDSIYILSLIHI